MTALVASSTRLVDRICSVITNLSQKDNVENAVVNGIELDHLRLMNTPTSRDDFLGKTRFIAFDTETTGMFALSNRIVEIAAVRFGLNDDTTETFASLVNPERPIPTEVIAIHGITDDMVAHAEPAAPVLKRFIEFCRPGDILIAHNAPFDISFVTCELERTGMEFGDNLILDTVDIFHRFFPGQLSYSLLNLSRSLGIAETQEHRALGDAILVKQLFQLAATKLPPVETKNDLGEVLDVYMMTSADEQVRELPNGFEPITTALADERRLEIVYASPGKPAQTRTIRPLRVHLFRSTYYLNAFCELAGAERTFRLDRIESFRLLDD